MSIHELAFAKQSARGTPATAAAFRIPLVGGTVKPRRQVELLEETGISRLRSQAYVVQAGVEGSPEYAVRPAALGLLLYGLLGAKAAVVPTVAVVSSSVANPSVITTSTPHGLTTGDTTTIAGHSGSTPDINGAHVVTVLTTTTFTIPINVTVGGTGGTATMGVTTHTFNETAEQPYMTFWRQLENLKYEKFVDCRITQMVLTSEAGRPLRAAMTVAGLDPRHLASGTYATEVAVAEESGAPFMHYDGAIERIVTTINNNNTVQQGDSHRPYDIAEGMLDLMFEVATLIEDAAEYNRFHYGSATPADGAQATKDVVELATSFLDFLWTRVAATAGPERSLRIQSGSKVQIVEVAGYEPNTNNDPIKKTSSYRSLRPSSGTGIVATLKNGTASY